jgi:predicted Zn-dependent protease with MMP-like domain
MPWKTMDLSASSAQNAAMNLKKLERMAELALEGLQRKLPPEMAAHAREVPVVMLARPTHEMLDGDGLDPDLLGLFVGPNRSEGVESGDPLPPEILLFLGNLWDYSENDKARFFEEVRVTYFHELGHYIGLEEGDLEDRGLE